jgi:hypothetical protein
VHGVQLKAEGIQTNIVFFDLDLGKLHVEHVLAKIQGSSPNSGSGGTSGGAGPVLKIEGSAGQGPVDIAEVLDTARGKGGRPLTTAGAFAALLNGLGRVRVGSYGTDRLRAVTHHQIRDEDVDRFVTTAAIVAELMSKA